MKHELRRGGHWLGSRCSVCGVIRIDGGERVVWLVRVGGQEGLVRHHAEPRCPGNEVDPHLKAYKPPTLTPLGKVRDLTHSAHGSSADLGGNGSFKAPSA